MNLHLGKVLLLPGILTISMIMQAPAMAEYNHGSVRRDGCYMIGDERVKFVSQVVNTNSDGDLKTIASSVSSLCDKTDVWDDKWYYWTLPDNRNKYLLLSWKNLNSGEYGYVFIQNTPETWWYKTNSKGFKEIPNGEQRKETWSTNGTKIDIDLKNPKNSGDWTPDDIWYSFGY
jgi:hypothetical protein